MQTNDGWQPPPIGYYPLDEDLERRIEEERDWEGQEEARQDADRPSKDEL